VPTRNCTALGSAVRRLACSKTQKISIKHAASSTIRPDTALTQWLYSPKYFSAIWMPSSYIFWNFSLN
jgi:hypothetical protein